MKLIMIALALSTSVFATNYNCEKTQFSDLRKIKISIFHGDVIVTQYLSDGSKISQSLSSSSNDEFSATLSSWNGYKRVLTRIGNSFIIEYGDECSSGTVYLNCSAQSY
jgi:hypothetical protein